MTMSDNLSIHQENVTGNEKTVFIRKVDCQLNSTSLDQIEDDQVIYYLSNMF